MSRVLELLTPMRAIHRGLGGTSAEHRETSVELLDDAGAERWDQCNSATICGKGLERAVSPGEKRVKFGSSTKSETYESVSTFLPDEEDDDDQSGFGTEFVTYESASTYVPDDEDDDDHSGFGVGSPEKFEDLSIEWEWDFEGEVVLEDTEQARSRPHLPEELPVRLREFFVGRIADKKPASVPSPWADLGASFAAAAAGAATEEEPSAPHRFTHRRQRSCPWQE
uniref:Uncharacterized protein n=1 Tax=Pyrodinium bahamense TaxID=73915 RepID=A0A7S0AJG1_9DINO|mmetsp:Transcript_35981/g.99779  ORF Transcript_35981/g.99779 Transcript_35981/m.99779 type:complete len:225 (+) Transcript_35981:58-732(+)|eukprot:CAMPEP_0179075870 /NCGR_PEP_ID=MMETSP0796-20121207/33811_1 /TAXON_ID=73915 /ORGANISM="Pyrodinium bahamense, Strain pbaha01" /LENGTH=224 /DNA_ID=CAMNT_0020773111 /DNA_START=53 /DNA_END=727 /DNA_ORIENTATION=+